MVDNGGCFWSIYVINQEFGLTVRRTRGTQHMDDIEETDDLFRPLKEPGNSYDMAHSGNVNFGVDAVRVTKSILSPLKDPLIEVHLTYKSQAFAFENHAVANNRASGHISEKLNV